MSPFHPHSVGPALAHSASSHLGVWEDGHALKFSSATMPAQARTRRVAATQAGTKHQRDPSFIPGSTCFLNCSNQGKLVFIGWRFWGSPHLWDSMLISSHGLPKSFVLLHIFEGGPIQYLHRGGNNLGGDDLETPRLATSISSKGARMVRLGHGYQLESYLHE